MPVAREPASDHVRFSTCRNQLRLTSLEEHPVLISESTWQSKENRERLLELAFEGWGAPAYYTVDKNVLTAFSVGKGTAMVLDVGEDVTSCMPIYDGFVIRKGKLFAESLEARLRLQHHDSSVHSFYAAIHKSPIGGALMTNYLASLLKANSPPIEVRPNYLVKDRIAVPPNTAPRSTLREDRLTGATESYARYAQSQVLHNFKESILQTMETPYDEQQAALRPQRAFEFPDGYNTTFGTVRYRVPEVMFNPTGILAPEFLNMPAPTTQNSTIPTPSLREAKSVQELISSSLALQDPDLHPTLLSNIVVVGGPILTPGFLDRLQGELMRMPLGNAKPKIEAPGSLVGRKYSSWLGGSILASLGTFHQLWVGREEYMFLVRVSSTVKQDRIRQRKIVGCSIRKLGFMHEVLS